MMQYPTPSREGFWEILIRERSEGLIVMLSDGRMESLVGRVAYRRFGSVHKFVSFKRSLRAVIARGRAEADRLNSE